MAEKPFHDILHCHVGVHRALLLKFQEQPQENLLQDENKHKYQITSILMFACNVYVCLRGQKGTLLFR